MTSIRIKLLALFIGVTASRALALPTHDQAIPTVAQDAVVKVYGLGGVRGLEGYQSGFFVDDNPPTLITVDSLVLDGRTITIIDALGDRSEGRLIGRDAVTGLAIVECPETTTPPATVDLSAGEAIPQRSEPLWVLSNAFAIATGDEPVTVQRARLAAVAPMPLPIVADDEFSRPAIGTPAAGSEVLLLDAVTSNPGAGGGLVVDAAGAPVGALGAECRSPVTGAWINYATPIGAVQAAVERIRTRSDGRNPKEEPTTTPAIARQRLVALGLSLIPRITSRTPAYLEQVKTDSPAAAAGCRPDDLIVAVDGINVGTAEAAAEAIVRQLDRFGRADITLLRDSELVDATIQEDAP